MSDDTKSADRVFVARVAHAFRCPCGGFTAEDAKSALPDVAERIRALARPEFGFTEGNDNE